MNKYMANNGQISKDILIGWRVSEPLNTMGLYSKKGEGEGDHPLIGGIDLTCAKMMIFPDPVNMYIPAQTYNDDDSVIITREIIVQGTFAKVFLSIYIAYQQPATEEEIQFANEKGNGSRGPKLIDQMGDTVSFQGWKVESVIESAFKNKLMKTVSDIDSNRFKPRPDMPHVQLLLAS